MDSKTGATQNFSDYQPKWRWVQDQEHNILELELLQEFKKEELTVQMDTMGALKIRGEHKMAGKKPIIFQQDFRIPENCKRSGIKARFQNGVLKVFLPFREPPLIKRPAASEKKLPATETTTPVHKQSENESQPGRDATETTTPVHKQSENESQPRRDATETTTPVHKQFENESQPRRDATETTTPVHKQSANEFQPGQDAESPVSSSTEGERLAAEPASKVARESASSVATKDQSRCKAKYTRRISLGLKTRKRRLVSVGVAILVITVTLGFYAAYRLGQSREEGN